MLEISENILKNYLIRKTKKQKENFRKLIQENYDCEIQSSLINKNIIIGDVKTAKVVYTAHYDTPPRLIIPNFITPKNFIGILLYQILIIILLFIPYILTSLLCNFIFDLFYSDTMTLNLFNILNLTTSFLPLCVLLFIALLVHIGPANKSNTNDNTSGVITLIELYNKLDEEERKNCAFVFFDNEEKGLLGSRYFKGKYKKEMKNFILINFDCVADGEHFLFAYNKKSLYQKNDILDSFKPLENKIIKDGGFTYYPSDQIGFYKSIGICALKKNNLFGYYLDKIHTKYDREFQRENIEYLTNGFKKYQGLFKENL